MKVEEGEEEAWSRETVPKVMKIVCSRSLLRQRDLISLLLVSSSLNRTLLASPSLWQVFSVVSLCFEVLAVNAIVLCFQVIDLREMPDAGNRLLRALSLVSLLSF